MPGTLFVVATPIGNLEDLTFRAKRILGEVALVAAEDTRRTAKLLAHYGIHCPTLSVREHNEHREAARIVQRLQQGQSVALVTDAGTPGISDPGARLVRAVRDAGLPVVPIPGASAVTAALSVCGFPADAFVFLGYPPSSGAARAEWFAALAEEDRVCVFFEAPHRVERTLADLQSTMGNQPIIIGRELTKKHEELVIRPSKEAGAAKLQSVGEFVIITGPRQSRPETLDVERAGALFGQLTSCGLAGQDAIDAIAGLLHVKPQAVRKTLKKRAIAARQRPDTRAEP